MMNYKLAKQLKDAGFPKLILIDRGKVYGIPALSELIEACQKKCKFITLENETGYDWMVCPNLEEDGKLKCYGPTPEEAVANLWIAIHTKK